MHIGARQSKKALQFGKYHYESLIELVKDDDIDMIKLNKVRALTSIVLIEDILSDFRNFINCIDK